MDINVSQVLAFQRCELDWYYQYVMKRVRRSWNVPLKVGEWWHYLMETYFFLFRDNHPNPIHVATDLGSAEMIRMSLEADEAGFPDNRPEFISECRKLLSQFENNWRLRFVPTSILTIEEPIRRLLPDATNALKDGRHYLIGIPDTVVTAFGKRWHLQHKTASDRTNMDLFIRLAQRSLHELAYAWLLNGGSDSRDDLNDYGGTYMNIVRKLSAKALATNAGAAFVQELVPLNSREIWSAILDISRIADRMEAILSGTVSPIDNREADTNRFGNVLSPYFNVKLGIDTLRDDTLFTNFISRYDPQEP